MRCRPHEKHNSSLETSPGFASPAGNYGALAAWRFSGETSDTALACHGVAPPSRDFAGVCPQAGTRLSGLHCDKYPTVSCHNTTVWNSEGRGASMTSAANRDTSFEWEGTMKNIPPPSGWSDLLCRLWINALRTDGHLAVLMQRKARRLYDPIPPLFLARVRTRSPLSKPPMTAARRTPPRLLERVVSSSYPHVCPLAQLVSRLTGVSTPQKSVQT